MKPDVFISYHTESSSSVVQSIAIRLETLGVRCWYAPRDVEGSYAGSIKRAIDSCKIFLLVLNKASSESPHVLNEIDLAFERFKNSDIIIMPFHVADDDISDDARYYLSRMHWVDGRTPPFESRLEDLGRRVIQALKRDSGTSEKGKPHTEQKTPEGFTSEMFDDLSKLFPPEFFSDKKDEAQQENQSSEGFFHKIFGGKSSKVQKKVFKYGTYEGELSLGLPSGKGILRYNSGDVYEGVFSGGSPHGEGKFTYSDGSVYEGGIKYGTCHGKGRLVFSNGDIYEGDFVKNEIKGKGKYVWATGDIYEGDFVKGRPHGIGIMRYKNGVVQSGHFENGNFKLF